MNNVQIIKKIDQIIHNPSRYLILCILEEAQEVDFNFLLQATELTRGNLSVHATKLKEGGYLEVSKSFKGNFPLTTYKITKKGLGALKKYRQDMKGIGLFK
jgi:DNA-binding transcriptional ArsR family regulator